ncbi:type II toxin-antitoxin system VapC family toxin [Planktothrix pseudagardhii]|uniref:PIN domain protein like protein n=1 Tax=Planktothrix pseudagardhii TaxID=132604 RepID=A0A9W4CVD6_9CYAN|nr:PIN domain-containing protein [Planktothrix pseudagardhii]CAD5978231.1 PIN domain protein like protein [Planktothrix pseudagardhii]
MRNKILLDTGPLVSYLKRQDQYHSWVVSEWGKSQFPLFTCEAVISEACFLLHRTYGGEKAVIALLKSGVIKIPFHLTEEIEVIGNLMQRYQNVPMSLADACLVRMSELIPGSSILTLDSDFRIYRKNQHEMINLIIPAEI